MAPSPYYLAELDGEWYRVRFSDRRGRPSHLSGTTRARRVAPGDAGRVPGTGCGDLPRSDVDFGQRRRPRPVRVPVNKSSSQGDGCSLITFGRRRCCSHRICDGIQRCRHCDTAWRSAVPGNVAKAMAHTAFVALTKAVFSKGELAWTTGITTIQNYKLASNRNSAHRTTAAFLVADCVHWR